MRVLVTGGAGFIGSWIVQLLQGRADVRVLDDFSTGRPENLDGLEARLIEGSVTDRVAVRAAAEGVDVVFHLAAKVSVPESMQAPAETVRVNTLGTLIVLEEAARAGARKLVFSSSCSVYGDSPLTPKTEAMTPEPMSPYAMTKLEGERYCRFFSEQGRLATVALRYFNVYGPRQNPKSDYAAAVPIFATRALRDEPLTVFGDGEQTRDFVFVRDVARANIYAAENAAMTGVCNVGAGRPLSVDALARRIVEAAGSASPVVHGPERAGDVRHSAADASRLAAAGFRFETDFEQGLAETVDWFRKQA